MYQLAVGLIQRGNDLVISTLMPWKILCQRSTQVQSKQGGVGIRMQDRRPVLKKKRTSPKKKIGKVPRRTIQHSGVV